MINGKIKIISGGDNEEVKGVEESIFKWRKNQKVGFWLLVGIL